MGLFGKKRKTVIKRQETSVTCTRWYPKMVELEGRWFTFLSKMELKMNELCDAAMPELCDLYSSDQDMYKSSYHNMRNGILNQLRMMGDKARDVYEKQIEEFYESLVDDVEGKEEDALDSFRERCSDSHEDFEEKIDKCRLKIEATENEDLELKYQKILDEYDAIKDKFCCTQCGSPVSIPKLFFVSTYIECPSCRTQNTFEPSSQARELDHLGRALAESRTRHLIEKSEREAEREREIYYEIHELELSLIFEEDQSKVKNVESKIEELEQARKAATKNAIQIHKEYLRAMFDEWHRIVPDLKEQNERFYERLLKEVEKEEITNY